jgi:hypothetical protein
MACYLVKHRGSFEGGREREREVLVFWVVAPYSVVGEYRCFGGLCCLHRHGWWEPHISKHTLNMLRVERVPQKSSVSHYANPSSDSSWCTFHIFHVLAHHITLLSSAWLSPHHRRAVILWYLTSILKTASLQRIHQTFTSSAYTTNIPVSLWSSVLYVMQCQFLLFIESYGISKIVSPSWQLPSVWQVSIRIGFWVSN